MPGRLAHHMRHNVVAYLALFLALSGSAIAAKPLITGADVQDNSLTGADVRDQSLNGDDIVVSSLGKVGDADTLDGQNSDAFLGAGAKATDADKLDGKDSTAFFSTAQNVGSDLVTVFPGEAGTAIARCPAGTTVTGGGHLLIGGFAKDYQVTGETEAQNGWQVRVSNVDADGGPDTLSFRAFARCAS